MQLLRPHLPTLAIGLAAVIIEGTAGLAEPWPLKIVLDNVLKSKPGRGWIEAVVVALAGHDKLAILKLASLTVLAIAAIGGAAAYTQRYLALRVGQLVMHDLRQVVYSHIQRLSLSYHDRKHTGDLISRLTGDIDAIQGFISTGLLGAVTNSITLGGMAAIMFVLDWRFTLIALSVSPLLFAIVFRYTRLIKKASRDVRKKEGEMVSVIQEVLSSMRVVKAFSREEYEQRRLAAESLESIEMGLQARRLKVRLPALVDMIVAAGMSLVLWFGGRMALRGEITSGSLVLFIWYLGRMYKPMRDLSKMTDAFSKAAIGWERIRDVLETDRQVEDLPGARAAPRFAGEIELCDVSFSYERGSPVLKHVNLHVRAGQVAALVGPTGAGKTSIVNLIPRFYDPDSGSVKIDGCDVRHYRQETLRSQISFVLQETLLFYGSVWSNIAYGKPDATREEIVRAARLANAEEFIQRLPNGYDTTIGERGVTLSGGQRQRIAIARALIRNSPILILDEAATGLDAASENLVLEALGNLMEGKTAIVITHRFSAIRQADVIFAVNNGEIVERGRHIDLMSLGGLYARLHEVQCSGVGPAMPPAPLIPSL